MAGLSNEAELLGAMHAHRQVAEVADEKGNAVISVFRAEGVFEFPIPRLTVDATDMTLKEQNGIDCMRGIYYHIIQWTGLQPNASRLLKGNKNLSQRWCLSHR
eukprot:scaffold217472_cov36-Cyclotella_meneghiniana.AAC.1